MDFSKQLPRFLLVIILCVVGILTGMIFSNLALQFDPKGMGWDSLSNHVGYIFLGFLFGLMLGIISAVSLNKDQLKIAFNFSLLAFVGLLCTLIYLISF